MNKASEGRTSQKMLPDSAATLAVSLVSTYNQIIASTETSGTEASSAPYSVLRFANSDISTTSKTVTNSLTM
jgi:hypothetical protein